MNKVNNNVFNKDEIENKLKDFKEGQDYSVSPTDEPNIKTYNFHNDKLRSVFRDDRVPVRVTQEAYDGKDYTYRGHFEEGKDYSYSARQWTYDKDYQGDRGTSLIPDDHFAKGILDNIKWDEHNTIEMYGESGNFHTGQKYWEGHWIYRGKGNKNQEPEQIEPRNSELEMKRKHEELMNKLGSYQNEPQSEERDWKIEAIKKDIAKLESGIEGYSPSDSVKNKNDANDNLQKENQELRQQLTEVQKQLSEVLEELKKLKNNSVGQNNEKLTQQIVQNEKLIKDGENISVAEVKDQINKSEALMKEVNSIVSPNQDNKGNGSLPYVIGGSVVVAAVALISYYLVKKNKRISN